MKLINRIKEAELRDPRSHCTGNDATNRFYTTKLNPSIERDFMLLWRKFSADESVLVGCYRFQLEQLVEQGFCRRVGDKIQVTFFHDSDGFIRVRNRRSDPHGYDVGILDW